MAASSNSLDLALRIKTAIEGLQGLEQLADHIDAVGGDSKTLRTETAALSSQLSELARQSGAADNLKNLGTQSSSTASKLDKLRAETDSFAATAQTAGAKAAAGFAKTAEGVRSVETQLEDLRTLAERALGVSIGIEGAKQLVELADAAQQADARLKLVTSSEAEFTAVHKELLDISLQTRSSFTENIELYSKLANYTKELKLESGQLTGVVKTLNQSIQLSGVDARTASLGVTQLAQGLASGRLQGQDLRSVLEDIPGVAQTLAAGLGVTIGQLRKMAEEGALTPQAVINALLREGEAVDARFKQLPETVGGALVNLKSQLTAYIGEVNKGTVSTQLLVSGIEGIGSEINTLATVAQQIGTLALAKFVTSLVEKATAARAAANATKEAAQADADAAIGTANAARATAEETQALEIGLRAREAAARSALELAQAQETSAQASVQAARAQSEQAAATLEASRGLETEAAVAAQTGEALALLAEKELALSAAQKASAEASAILAVETKAQAEASTLAATANKQAAEAAEAATVAQSKAANAAALTAKELLSVNTGFSLFIAASLGYDFGTVLYDKFETVRKGGAYLAEGLVELVEVYKTFLDTMLHPWKIGSEWDELIAKLKSVHEGFNDVRANSTDAAVAQQKQAEAAKSGADANKLLAGAVGDAGDAAKKAEKQFDEAAKTIGLDGGIIRDGISSGARDAAKALGDLLESGKLSAAGVHDAIAKAIDSAKTSQDAAIIGQAISKAFYDGKLSADQMTDAVGLVTAAQKLLGDANDQTQQKMSEAAKALGIDYAQLSNTVSESGKAAVQAFTTLTEKGNLSLSQLGQTIDGTLAKLSTTKDFEAFEAALKQTFNDGKIPVDQFNATLDLVHQKLATLAAAEQQPLNEITLLTKGVQDLADAYDERIEKEKEAAAAALAGNQQTIDSNEKLEVSFDSLRNGIGNADSVQQLENFRAAAQDAFAKGKLSAEEYLAIVQQINEQEELLKTYIDLWSVARGAAEDFLGSISKKAKAYYDDLVGVRDSTKLATDSIDGMQASIKTLGQWITGNMKAYTDEWWGSLAKLANQGFVVERQTLNQKIALEQWIETLAAANDGTITAGEDLGDLANKAQRAGSQFSLLDDADLSRLQQQIDVARQKLQGLRDDAASTLTNLNEELAQAQGNLVKAQELRNAQREADLQAQLAQAQALGDKQSVATLTQALKTLQQINALSIASAQQQQAQQQASTSPATPTASSSSSSSSTKKVEVTLNVGGQRITGEFDESDADALVDALARAQSVSTH